MSPGEALKKEVTQQELDQLYQAHQKKVEELFATFKEAGKEGESKEAPVKEPKEIENPWKPTPSGEECLGLDIGRNFVRAALISPDLSVKKSWIKAVPKDFDTDAVLQQLKLPEFAHLPTAVCFSDLEIFTRIVTVTKAKDILLRQALLFELKKYSLPFKYEEAEIAYVVLDEMEVSGRPQLRVLLVAMPRAYVDKLQILLGDHVRLKALDVEPLSVLRALSHMTPLRGEGGSLILSLRVSGTYAIVMNGVSLVAVRFFPFSENSLAEALHDGLDIDLDLARKFLREYGHIQEKEEVFTTQLQESAQEILRQSFDEFSEEIRRYLHYYTSQEGLPSLQNIILAGEGVISPFKEWLETTFHVPVTLPPLTEKMGAKTYEWVSAMGLGMWDKVSRRINFLPEAQQSQVNLWVAAARDWFESQAIKHKIQFKLKLPAAPTQALDFLKGKTVIWWGVGIFTGCLFLVQGYVHLRSLLLHRTISRQEQMFATLQKTRHEGEKLERLRQMIAEKNRVLATVQKGQVKLSDVISDLRLAVPTSGIAFLSFEFEGNQFTLTGVAESVSKLQSFLEELKRSKTQLQAYGPPLVKRSEKGTSVYFELKNQ